MSYGSCIQRKVDNDMADRIESSGPIPKLARHRPNKGKPPRSSESYRWYRRYAKKFARQRKRLANRIMKYGTPDESA